MKLSKEKQNPHNLILSDCRLTAFRLSFKDRARFCSSPKVDFLCLLFVSNIRKLTLPKMLQPRVEL